MPVGGGIAGIGTMPPGHHLDHRGKSSGNGEALQGEQGRPAHLAVVRQVAVKVEGADRRKHVHRIADEVAYAGKRRGHPAPVFLGELLHRLVREKEAGGAADHETGLHPFLGLPAQRGCQNFSGVGKIARGVIEVYLVHVGRCALCRDALRFRFRPDLHHQGWQGGRSHGFCKGGAACQCCAEKHCRCGYSAHHFEALRSSLVMRSLSGVAFVGLRKPHRHNNLIQVKKQP